MSAIFCGMAILKCSRNFLADAINYYVFEDTGVPYYVLFGKIVIRFHKKKTDTKRGD